METRPLHQNLDTAFVNVSALVKYLRRRQFIGCIKIQLNGYKAEIQLDKDNQLKVVERDEISGRVSEGKEAFQRLLIRAREPGGSVNVFQKTNKPKSEPVKKKTSVNSVEVTAVKRPAVLDQANQPEIAPPIPQPESNPFVVKPVVENGNRPTPVQKSPKPRRTAAVKADPLPVTVVEPIGIALKDQEEELPKPTLPDFPFELSNNFENRAKKQSMSSQEWQILMKLSVELLGVIDKTLANYRLDFAAAFEKVRGEICEDYPFMSIEAGVFRYRNGRIEMTKQVNESMFVSSICESIRKIVEKLGANPKFHEQHRAVSQVLVALLQKRKPHYEKFGYAAPIQRVLGV